MRALEAVTHAFVIWMPALFLLPCLSVWAVLIQGELRDDDEANTSER
jgi:hypothetical protein